MAKTKRTCENRQHLISTSLNLDFPYEVLQKIKKLIVETLSRPFNKVLVMRRIDIQRNLIYYAQAQGMESYFSVLNAKCQFE